MSDRERDLTEGRARVNPQTGEFYTKTSWAAVDLEPFKRGERITHAPEFLPRTDGKMLIYPDRPHVFFGESESLKSWAALLACRSVVKAGKTAVYIDTEGDEASFVERCRVTGIDDGFIGGALTYVRPTEPLKDDARVDLFLFELEQRDPALVVLDGVTEFYSLQGWDVNKAEDAARFQHTFNFRGRLAFIAIDHTAKDAGRGVFGSQHKRAGLDGAEYEFKSRVRRGRGGHSVAEVSVTKDRHGYVREWASGMVGRFHVGVDAPDEGVDMVRLEPTKPLEHLDPRDDRIDRIVAFVSENPGATFTKLREGASLGEDDCRDAMLSAQTAGRIENRGSDKKHSWHAVV